MTNRIERIEHNEKGKEWFKEEAGLEGDALQKHEDAFVEAIETGGVEVTLYNPETGEWTSTVRYPKSN